MIVFDETQRAIELLEKGSKCISLRDLSTLAKYFREEEGCSFKKIEKELISYCKRCDPDFNPIKKDKLIQKAISSAKNYNLRKPEPIIVTQNEINRIRSVNNFPYERVLFVMLVVAKFFKFGVKKKQSKKAKLHGYFISNKQLAKVISLARVRLNKEERNAMIHFFYCQGLIDTTYAGALRICYTDDNSVPYKVIDNYDDIIQYYPPICAECGKEIDGVKQRVVCADCKAKRVRENNRLRVQRSRKNKSV